MRHKAIINYLHEAKQDIDISSYGSRRPDARLKSHNKKGDIMDAVECIKKRMSIRAFRREEVPRELLVEVFNIAKWSPSYKNSQPCSPEGRPGLNGLLSITRLRNLATAEPASPGLNSISIDLGLNLYRICFSHLFSDFQFALPH